MNARRRGNELRLVALDAAARERALAVAADLLAAAKEHVGRTREELDAALSAVDVGPREYRLRDGLAKLVEDRCQFDAAEDMDPVAIRREVFVRASALRAALAPTERFDRRMVLAEIAAERGTTPETVDRSLFADLRGAHVLTAFDGSSAETLVDVYESAQAQAVLLRAVKVTVDVECASASSLRGLFRRLKFLRLLHAIEPRSDGHRVVIDGPFSLFESVTKYGLQLAMMLPALEGCDRWRLEADVRWGKDRLPLVFRLEGQARGAALEPPSLPDEVQALKRSFEALDAGWKVAPNGQVLELPGVGLTVPDLVFERTREGARGSDRARVYLEVMGYWSRDAVWRRVELVRAGLAARVLFAVSAKLRVSEEVLEDDLPGALYVYKQTMSARSVLERVERLAADQNAGVASPR
ncbi:MAG TPA: DUF790 family protein [Polyangiaceae bacterium]|nr:DUF790 family protein [Polyangiaceae bacterium]